MDLDRQKEENNKSGEEPKDRFYIRKWQATRKEMAEVREFVKSHKTSSNNRNSTVVKNIASGIIEKVVR